MICTGRRSSSAARRMAPHSPQHRATLRHYQLRHRLSISLLVTLDLGDVLLHIRSDNTAFSSCWVVLHRWKIWRCGGELVTCHVTVMVTTGGGGWACRWGYHAPTFSPTLCMPAAYCPSALFSFCCLLCSLKGGPAASIRLVFYCLPHMHTTTTMLCHCLHDWTILLPMVPYRRMDPFRLPFSAPRAFATPFRWMLPTLPTRCTRDGAAAPDPHSSAQTMTARTEPAPVRLPYSDTRRFLNARGRYRLTVPHSAYRRPHNRSLVSAAAPPY